MAKKKALEVSAMSWKPDSRISLEDKNTIDDIKVGDTVMATVKMKLERDSVENMNGKDIRSQAFKVISVDAEGGEDDEENEDMAGMRKTGLGRGIK